MIRFSIGHGKRAGKCDRTADAEDFADFQQQLLELRGPDEWWSPHEWTGGARTQAGWLGASLIAADVDYYGAGPEGKVEHAPLPDALRQMLVDAWEAGTIPGDAMHTTPRGLRVVVLLPERCAVEPLYRAAATGVAKQVEDALRSLTDADLRLDAASWDTARYLWAPNARVDGHARSARWLSREPGATTVEAWAARAVAIITKGKDGKRAVDTDLRAARDRWLADHPLPDVDAERTCPTCKHAGCWGVLPDSTTRWWCWSDSHDKDSGGCGRKADSGRGWFGDALDLAAHARGISTGTVLEQDGYLIRAGAAGRTDVLLPGAHQTGEGTLERGTGDFVNDVLGLLTAGRAFRRGTTLVGLDAAAGVLRAYNATTAVALAEQTVRPVRWFKTKEDGPFKGYAPMNGNHGRMILDASEATEILPMIDGVATFPTYARQKDGSIVRITDGYNPDTRMYLVPDADVSAINASGTAQEAQAALGDLLTDFPFADDASVENTVLLILTLMMRPACDTVPLFHVGASLERTGKTKLLRECVGVLVTGRLAPILMHTESEEETRKRLDALALEGQPFAIIDNLPTGTPTDSPSLAAAITSSSLKFRILGRSEMQEARNTLTLATTGNNSRFSAELVKRAVPITLRAKDDAPEKRGDFAHPDVEQYVRERRPVVLSLLVGAVERWMAAGRPDPVTIPRIGGFERWWSTVCGVAEHGLGLRLALSNRDDFTAASGDGVSDDARALVKQWATKFGGDVVKQRALYELSDGLGLFANVMDGCAAEHADKRAAFFARYVLDGRMRERPTCGYIVTRTPVPGHYLLRGMDDEAPKGAKPEATPPPDEQGSLDI